MIAQPIWHPRHSGVAFFRHRFRLRHACASCWIRCAASGPYQVRLDDVRLGSGPGGSGVRRPMWTEFAVEGGLSPGEHELLVQAAPAAEGEASWVLCEGALAGGSGDGGGVVELGTNGGWWTAPSPAPAGLKGAAKDMEAFSALRDPTRCAEGEGDWVQAVCTPSDGVCPVAAHPIGVREEEVLPVEMPSFGEIDLTEGSLGFVAAPGPMRTCKCVHREGILRGGRVPVRVQTRGGDRAVYLLLDFGRLVNGLPHLHVRGGSGGIIDMGFSCTWGHVHSQAQYRCGPGLGEWVGLRPRTCRYLILRLHGFGESCEIERVSLWQGHVKAKDEATFSASGEVAAVWDTGRWTLDSCRRDVYCLGETADAHDWLRLRALALDDYYLTGETATAAATAASARLGCVGADELPDLVGYPLFVESLHMHAGDAASVEELLKGVTRIADAIVVAAGMHGLVPTPRRGRSTIAYNAVCCGALAATARLCVRLGRGEEGDRYQLAGESLCRALQVARTSQGLFGDEVEGGEASQWTNGLILCFGIEAEQRRLELAQAIRADVVAPVADLVGAFYLAEGLWEAGAEGAAMDIAAAHWSRIAERGGPAWQDKITTQTGAVSPGPEYLLGSRLVGLRPVQPGYAAAEVGPPLVAGRRAAGRFATARGRMAVEWRRHQGQHPGFELQVEQEEPGPMQLRVPRCGLRFPTITVNGETVWRNEKIYPNAAVREITSEPDCVVLGVERAGQYTISSE